MSGTDHSATILDQHERLRLIRQALLHVTDPEIPVLNIVEMGMIADVRLDEDVVVVDVTPTFAGCPALDLIRQEIHNAVFSTGESKIRVNIVFDPPWTTDRLSDEAREKLKAFGLAPPGRRCAGSAAPDLSSVNCPYCDSTDTELESIFGPTLCRSIHYCHGCLQSFEHFKSV